jgi:hypothetical protein
MGPTVRSLGLAFVALASGCVTARGQYLRTLDDHTGMGVVYRGFGTALRFRATYLSPGFREALAEERRRLLDADASDHARFLSQMESDREAYHEVVFTAESDVETRTEFGDTDDVWRVRLEADGVPQPLVTVYRVRDVHALHEMIYAHKNIWNDLWIARFERITPTPGVLEFQVASGFGHDEVQWRGEAVR